MELLSLYGLVWSESLTEDVAGVGAATDDDV